MLRLKSKGATLLRANGALKINNNCAIQFGPKKLTIGEMVIPPGKFRANKVDARRNDNPPETYLMRKRRIARKRAQNTSPTLTGGGIIKKRWKEDGCAKGSMGMAVRKGGRKKGRAKER